MIDWIHRAVEKTVAEMVAEKLPGIVEARLPTIIETHLTKRFREDPCAQLTLTGFSWAFFLALRRCWPSVSHEQADRYWQEYVGAPFGDDGFEWTPAAAEELARSYAQQFGEVA